MILFLNYIQWMILVVGSALFGYFLKNKKTKSAIIALVVTSVLFSSYIKMNPTYIQKGTVQSLPPVEVPISKGEIKNNLLSPESPEERERKFNQKINQDRTKAILEDL